MLSRKNLDLIFEVNRLGSGSYSADCLNARIEVKGGNWEELYQNITLAIEAYFPEPENRPAANQVHIMYYDAVAS